MMRIIFIYMAKSVEALFKRISNTLVFKEMSV